MKRILIILLATLSLNSYAGPYVKERPENGDWQFVATLNRTPDYPGDKSAWINYIDLKSINRVGNLKVATVYVEFVSNTPGVIKHKWLNTYYADCNGRTLIKDSGEPFKFFSPDELAIHNFICSWKI